MDEKKLVSAIDKLTKEFKTLDLSFHKMGNGTDITSYWPGEKDEDIIVCVFKGNEITEPFHRQDFFFINYAYRNCFDALSAKYDNLITVLEGECYIGQPYSGYALRGKSEEEIVIVGVLIKKDAFFKEYLSMVYTDAELFRFFLNPKTNKFSDEFIHLSVLNNQAIRSILELMIIEYAEKQSDNGQILKSMLQTLLLEIARLYKLQKTNIIRQSISEKIFTFMDDNSDVATLKSVASHFGYHPNYISSLIHKKTGSTFSDILTEKRMTRAVLLMKNTSLSIEEISKILGYSNHSNFYKAFKSYYGTTPRGYIEE